MALEPGATVTEVEVIFPADGDYVHALEVQSHDRVLFAA